MRNGCADLKEEELDGKKKNGKPKTRRNEELFHVYPIW
jgi:hypothetical protein